jgi:GT2 family glycosyltransferase
MKRLRTHSLPKISVIIVNYNVREFLHQSIISLKKALRGIPSEIIVVDNASDDGSNEMVQNKFPGVQLISMKTNSGFAAANNAALKVARGKYLFLLNPDTIVQEDTVSVMLNFMEEHPDAGMAGCKVLNPDGTFQLPCRRGFLTPWTALTKIIGLGSLFPSFRLFGGYNITYRSTEETYSVDAISGSCMFVRREAYENVGGLDESYFMYGEDLDWCYRILRAGWKVYYVHSTQIIHYRGESTKRSNVDEMKMFYEAMHIFVQKHYHSSPVTLALLRLSIGAVSFAAFISALLRPWKAALIDWFLIDGSLVLAEYVRRGKIFAYPDYAYPVIFSIPAIIVIANLYSMGVYTTRKLSVSRTILAVGSGYIILSALTAFFKTYAFSRMIVLFSGLFVMILLPLWRFLLRRSGRRFVHEGLLGMRTALVGTDAKACELLKKLRTAPQSGYEIIGLIGTSHKDVGEKLSGIPVLASIENINKAIHEYRLSDIIFAPDSIPYSQILSIMSHVRESGVAFHLVPNTMDVVVGKTSIDILDQMPLVQLSFNISKPFHRFNKRIFDILLSGLLFIIVCPILYVFHFKKLQDPFFRRLVDVLKGRRSFVGPYIELTTPESRNIFIGKPGLTGLAQLKGIQNLSAEEMAQYNLYYARHQSILTDGEILFRTLLKRRHVA